MSQAATQSHQMSDDTTLTSRSPGSAAKPAPAVLRLPQNLVGRDFVVGDIHGAYDLVLLAMRQVDFDGRVDRLLCAGDLIDRGPQSWRCLKFLQQPYVYCVRGNHDDSFAQLFSQEDPPEAAWSYMDRIYKTDWAREISAEQRREIAFALGRLPLAIEVPTARGLVGIVHGDVPAGWDWARFTGALEASDAKARECALEGRQRVLGNDSSGVAGVDRLFVGHTPRDGGARRYGNVFAVDTGAIFHVLKDEQAMGLTFANLCAATSALAVPQEESQTFAGGLNLLPQAAAQGPFGNYVRARQT